VLSPHTLENRPNPAITVEVRLVCGPGVAKIKSFVPLSLTASRLSPSIMVINKGCDLERLCTTVHKSSQVFALYKLRISTHI